MCALVTGVHTCALPIDANQKIPTALAAMLRCKGRRSKVPCGRRRLLPASAALLLAGCGGPQSALVTAGREAEAVAGLFWIMLGGAVFIWVLVIRSEEHTSELQ